LVVQTLEPRVLVVDDEPRIQRFLRPALEASDFEVETTDTAALAKRMAATRSPALIVLDLGLPDGDGKDVIQELRAFSEVPIIVLSARDQETEKLLHWMRLPTTISKSPSASANCSPASAWRCAMPRPHRRLPTRKVLAPSFSIFTGER
jgi:CheY-like chemotaxis protein